MTPNLVKELAALISGRISANDADHPHNLHASSPHDRPAVRGFGRGSLERSEMDGPRKDCRPGLEPGPITTIVRGCAWLVLQLVSKLTSVAGSRLEGRDDKRHPSCRCKG